MSKQTFRSTISLFAVMLVLCHSCHSLNWFPSGWNPIYSGGGTNRYPFLQIPGRPSETDKPEPKLVFPDYVAPPEPRSQFTKLPPAPVCEGSTYCEEVDNYPEELANKLVRSDPTIRELQIVDRINPLTHRIGPSTTPLCLSRPHLIRPKSGETVDKEWLFILNTNEFEQAVAVEKCINLDQPCQLIGSLLAPGYVSKCEQQTVTRRMVGLTPDGNKTRQEFTFPSSCCCHVEYVGLAARFGPFADFLPGSSDRSGPRRRTDGQRDSREAIEKSS